MNKREKFEGTDIADIVWIMVEADRDKAEKSEKTFYGTLYWEDCLEIGDILHRLGYRRVAEPESSEIIKGEVVGND